MGRAHRDGYRLDNPSPGSNLSAGGGCGGGGALFVTSTRKPPLPTPPITAAVVSPANNNARMQDTVGSRSASTGRARDRLLRNRRPKNTGCKNPQVRKGIGSCVFVLGIPCLIAGLILTIVSSADDEKDGRKYPASFPVLGPSLIALSVVCFLIGIILYNIAILSGIRDCLNLTDKDSFFRRRFPRLSAWLKPDVHAARNQAAINNLKTAPARSALRKIPNPDLATVETELCEREVRGEDESQGGHPHHHRHRDNNNHHSHPENNHHHHYHHHHASLAQHPPRRKRAVTFLHGGDSTDFVNLNSATVRPSSLSSEPDRLSLQSENGGNNSLNGHSPSSSLLSLRHCRVHPKDDVFCSESSATNDGDRDAGMGADGGEGKDGDGCASGGGDVPVGHPSAASASSTLPASGEVGEDGDAEGGVRFSLTDIDEERA